MESKSGNVLENTHGCSMDSVWVQMAYDGSGKRVFKTCERKERDDATELNYFGARYLDPMLGLWVSVDAARQYQNPYLYAGNNPVMRTDPDGNADVNAIINGAQEYMYNMFMSLFVKPQLEKAFETSVEVGKDAMIVSSVAYGGMLATGAVVLGGPIAVEAATNYIAMNGPSLYLAANSFAHNPANYLKAIEIGFLGSVFTKGTSLEQPYNEFVDGLSNALPEEIVPAGLSNGSNLGNFVMDFLPTYEE